jgi:hypothetical protein
MPKLKIFKPPKNYADYSFWRSEHQRIAIFVMIGAGTYALLKWFL